MGEDQLEDAIKTIAALFGLIITSVLGWFIYTIFLIIALLGVMSLGEIFYGKFALGIPYPEWWLIMWIVMGIFGAFKFYEEIKEIW